MTKIIRKSVWKWTGTEYRKVYEDAYDWNGPVALACGATGAQTNIEQSQQNFMNQLQTQAGAVFGNASAAYTALSNTFTPTVQAGPNQQGFSPQELSTQNSEAITQTGTAYQNAKAAVGNQLSAEGGGNTELPAGSTTATNLGLAESGANQTASELAGITEENYAVGRQNYENATKGLESAGSVYNPATGAAGAATSAGSAAASTANQIASQQNSWIQPVIGALSGVAGAATGGLSNILLGGASAATGAITGGLGQVAGYTGGEIGNNTTNLGGAPSVDTAGWEASANQGTGPLSAFGS